ncbi:hypothetical protein RhiirA4_463615 [Rhizophagus irregularis]|uniref:Uncharacterized protein n=1 Tax=Rhizophagus irregularis TaxID=588596 RepID=A0A2I1GNA1_9GLOM|nr:hypothetical protein RhiirA4_463615 [Rhizophagus irregularis]
MVLLDFSGYWDFWHFFGSLGCGILMVPQFFLFLDDSRRLEQEIGSDGRGHHIPKEIDFDLEPDPR